MKCIQKAEKALEMRRTLRNNTESMTFLNIFETTINSIHTRTYIHTSFTAYPTLHSTVILSCSNHSARACVCVCVIIAFILLWFYSYNTYICVFFFLLFLLPGLVLSLFSSRFSFTTLNNIWFLFVYLFLCWVWFSLRMSRSTFDEMKTFCEYHSNKNGIKRERKKA